MARFRRVSVLLEESQSCTKLIYTYVKNIDISTYMKMSFYFIKIFKAKEVTEYITYVRIVP